MKEICPPLRIVLEEYSAAVKDRYGDQLRGLRLYGLQTHGKADATSDADILLVPREVTHSSREIDRIGDLFVDFNLKWGVLLSVLPVDEHTLNSTEGDRSSPTSD